MKYAKRWLMGTMADAAMRASLPQRLMFNGLPLAVVLACVLLAWYAGAWGLNAPGAIERVMNNIEPAGAWTAFDLFKATMQMERPLLPAVIDHLCQGWTSGVLDLRDRLVVVPTKNAGRRLREGLALRAAARETGVLPPRVLTPESFIMSGVVREGMPIAGPIETQIAWSETLRYLPVKDFPTLFPAPPEEQSFSWALGVARAIEKARHTFTAARPH